MVADTREIQRHAFNAAFYELGLRWNWCPQTFDGLQQRGDERTWVRDYLQTHQSHLLKAWEADCLVDAVMSIKDRHQRELHARGTRPAARVDWSALNMAQVGA